MEASKSSPPLPKNLRLVDETKFTSQAHLQLVDETRPLESSWLSRSFHQYQGYWFPTMYLQVFLEYRNHFKARGSDIFLVTFPKSGTTWLKAILFALANRTRYHPASPDHPLLSKNPHDLLIFMELMINPHSKKKVPDFFWSTPQRIFSTHTPYVLLSDSVKESSCEVIYLCRNPKDVFISTWNYLNKLRKNWCSPLMLDEAVDKLSLGGPYWDNLLGHWKESLANPGKVTFLKYEDLKQCPGMVVRNVAEYLGCPISKYEESKGIVDDIIEPCDLEKLSSLEVNGSTKKISMIDKESSSFFRMGKVGDWADCLTPEMVARIDHITEEKFRGSGLSF